MNDTDFWAPYTPGDAAPWNLRRVVHLHRRAGFAATWTELQRDLQDGPTAAVDRLLRGRAALHTPVEFGDTAALLVESAVAAGDIHRLRAAWLFRMIYGPDPLRERLTLFWHGHFGTGYAKVRDVAAMASQNATLRRLALAPFGELLGAAVREPALLVYLDAPANRRGHPNENLARELMELFTLGVGHFSEEDVKGAARAITGWTVRDSRFQELAERQDTDAKTILGQRGAWTGADLLRIVLAQPASARRLAAKLCQWFFGETGVPQQAVESLAAGLGERRLDVGWAVETILRSDRFYAADNIGTRIVGPAELIVGAVRALEMFDAAPSTLALADWSARLGQNLFDPPNVGGWPGGRDWINPRSMILRTNFAVALLSATGVGRPRAYDPAELARRHNQEAIADFHHRLLLGVDPTPEWSRRNRALPTSQVVAALLASPEGQLG